MTYSKPEITLLGAATRVIEGDLINKDGVAFDGVQPDPNQARTMAYDLDD